MALKITSLSPSVVPLNWEGDLIIHGMELGSAGFMSIDGKDPTISSWTAVAITADIKQEITQTAGDKRLVVHDRDGNFDETTWRVERATR